MDEKQAVRPTTLKYDLVEPKTTLEWICGLVLQIGLEREVVMTLLDQDFRE